MEKPELSIMTFNVKGKLPVKLSAHEKDIVDYINKSKFEWQFMEEGVTPRLITRPSNTNMTVVLWFSGSIQFLNPGNMENALVTYEEILNDLKKYCRRLFE